MFARILTLTTLVAGPVWAQEWQRLSGVEIESALNGTALQYEGSRQVFYASGRTMYDNGRPSWGYWTVRGEMYCSQWPPADGWACYDLDRLIGDGKLRFVSETGATTEGFIVE